MKYKLYHGTSPFLSLEMFHLHVTQLKQDIPSAEITIIDGESTDPQKILDTVSSQNLFTSERIFLLKRVYKNKKKEIILEALLKLLPTTTSNNVFLFWEDHKVKSNTKYYKFFKAENAIEETDALNKRSFFTWLKKEIERENIQIDAQAQRFLAEKTNYDPERCSNELKKLKLKGDQISSADIGDVTADTLESDIWKLIDAINSGDKALSIDILERLNQQSVDSNYTLSMLARNLRLITLTKHLLSQNFGSSEISSMLKIPPFTTPSLIKTSKNYSDEKLLMLYTKLSNLDWSIKTGRIDGKLGLTLICPYL